MKNRFKQPEWKKQRQEQALREKFEKALPNKSPRPQKASGWKWLAIAGVALLVWTAWRAAKLA